MRARNYNALMFFLTILSIGISVGISAMAIKEAIDSANDDRYNKLTERQYEDVWVSNQETGDMFFIEEGYVMRDRLIVTKPDHISGSYGLCYIYITEYKP